MSLIKQAVVVVLAGSGLLMRVQGRGLTFGKARMSHGIGKFTGVANVREVLDNHAHAEAQPGAVKSTDAQALTKGKVALALSGRGEG